MPRCFLAAVLIPCLLPPPGRAQHPLKPTNLDKLNTPQDEDDPFLSADRLRLYYASDAGGRFNLLVSERKALNQPWPAGKPLQGPTGDSDDRSPFLTPDNHDLFFATRFVVKDKNVPAGPDNFDLVRSIAVSRTGHDFTAPVPVQAVCTPADELHPWLAADGKELYFSRKTKEGWSVFVSGRKDAKTAFGEPKRVAGLPAGFHHATVSRDGRVLYVQGPLEKGRWGLFKSVRPSGAGAWGEPEPLTDLNSPEAPTGDVSPCLSADGTKLYFASDRPGGKGGRDLWVIDTARLAVPHPSPVRDGKP
jgi:hypothetical protein